MRSFARCEEPLWSCAARDLAGRPRELIDDSVVADADGGAAVASIFGGYDWWIGPQWSVGLMLIGSATTTTSLRDDEDNDEIGYSFRSMFIGLEWALLLH